MRRSVARFGIFALRTGIKRFTAGFGVLFTTWRNGIEASLFISRSILILDILPASLGSFDEVVVGTLVSVSFDRWILCTAGEVGTIDLYPNCEGSVHAE